MTAFRARLLFLTLASLVIVDGSSSQEAHPEPSATASPHPHLAALPVRFEANAGQWNDATRFVARHNGASLALSEHGATLSLRRTTGSRPARRKAGPPMETASTTTLSFAVADGRIVAPAPSEPLTSKTNYLLGNDRSRWRIGVPSYGKVTYPSVRDGVDLVYHGENGTLEYDFVVAPGVDPQSVAMTVGGADGLAINEAGELVIHTPQGDLIQPPPLVYQREARGEKRAIASRYKIVGNANVGFEVASYDRSKPVVIDPVIGFARFVGGSGDDSAEGVALDASGNSYIVGTTTSPNLPVSTTAKQPELTPCGECLPQDAFVAKLSPNGTIQYLTYLGGSGFDSGYAIAVDSQGRAYVGGQTSSIDFPTTPRNPIDGDSLFTTYNVNSPGPEGFVVRVEADGASIGYGSYVEAIFGGTDVQAIAVDATFHAHIAGSAREAIAGIAARGAVGGDAYVAKIDAAGDGLVAPLQRFGQFGGSSVAYGVALDPSGNVYVAGDTTASGFPTLGATFKDCSSIEDRDAFLVKLTPDLNATFATCLGGTGDDGASSVAVDGAGNAYLTGSTSSSNFPTTPNAFQPSLAGGQDAFVAKVSAANTLSYATLLGGSNEDQAFGITVDSVGSAWVTGSTSSGINDVETTGFPLRGALQTVFGGGVSKLPTDAFVARFKPDGSDLVFSSFYGATGDESGLGIAARTVNSGTSVSFCGASTSAALPATLVPTGGQQDGFVAQITVPRLIISPPSALVPVGKSQVFQAIGGAGAPYVFSLTQNQSGGGVTTDGTYNAGVTGGTTDVVTVTDPVGLTASATITVGVTPATLVVSPTSTTVAPRGQRSFTASGGVPPYSFSFASNASGGSVSPSGLYVAGSRGNTNDIVRVNDAAGAQLTASVAVTGGLSITPTKPAVPPNGKISFSATGGSGSGFAWSLLKNGSGATLGATTGVYDAGSRGSTVDTVQVSDSLGNKASVNVSVGGGLAITPSDPATPPRGSIAFSAVGGSGSYSWTLSSALSGGTVDASSGVYTAGPTGNVLDVVQVSDTLGNRSAVQVTVGPALEISPTTATLQPGATLAFTAAGGSGEYAFALATNASGATISGGGGYAAGTQAGADTVRLSDSLGATSDALVTVNAPPGSGAGTPLDGGAFDGINIGGGGTDDCSCTTVGYPGLPGYGRIGAGLLVGLALVMRRRRR